MVNGTDDHSREIEFRRRWYEAHCRRAKADPDYEEIFARRLGFRARAAEVFPMRDRLAADGDLDRFREDLHSWGRNSGVVGFNGPSGSGFVNTLVKRTDDRAELVRLLTDGLTAPSDHSAARSKIEALVEHIERIRTGGHPAPGHVPFLLSFFWDMDESHRWPILWPGARKFLELMTGQELSEPPADRYLRFVDLIRELDNDSDRFLVTAYWWDQRRPVLLDSVLVDRCAFGMEPVAPIDGSDPSRDYERTRENGIVLAGISQHIGKELADDLADAVGHQLSKQNVEPTWGRGSPVPRPTIFTRWRLKDKPVALRVHINRRGAFIGIEPVWIRRGWYTEFQEAVSTVEVEGFRVLSLDHVPLGGDKELDGPRGEYIYGRWYEPDQLDGLDLRAEVKKVATAAKPVIKDLIKLSKEPPLENGEEPDSPETSLDVRIDEAAAELLVARSFLDDIVSLLEDKHQVILYGPPGTGKTYLAKRLAEALAPDSGFRGLVQFHPSTSYEDFFEGYRPVPAAGGGIGYELTRGPLARMAAHAEEHPGRHVMVIDEINRANLPRVLGELLFLLEYREEQVSTLYRSGGEFRLPESLWFIGTMNTADRSIALVDAALRRRFHFVPFFPGRGPTVGLLERWLDREGQPGWVGELVAMVNGELTKYVGEDLQLGFSHFLRKGYRPEPSKGDEVLRRIWEYNIEPFVEDQLFGDRTRIEQFRFENVVNRFLDQAGYARSQDDPADQPDPPEGESDGPEDLPDEGTTS